MQTDNPKCPDQNTLLQFIQGRLEPPKLDHCEDHISDCQSCHETLRGLDANDTLSHYVSDALEQSPVENPSDTQAIDGLMHRLLQPVRGTDAEILADRAAEVLRCVEPAAIGDEDSLGTLGDYRLLHLIGAGGTGVVFQAKDEALDRIVALKVLRPSLGDIARERFIAEARLAASIEHDNVVTIYQIGQEGRLAFIAMQWLPGETLEARLNRSSETLDEEVVREFVSQIASGLSAAHHRQLIHRDIKPANIWICDDTGRIKILDFGLARIADEESSLTQTGMLAGTPSFMSPEQARGMELDPRSDLFSLGCVMYLLLTGRLPFSSSTVLGTLQTIQSDSPPTPTEVNPRCDADLSDLTMSLLEKLPGNRMASAENLIRCLSSKRSAWPQAVPKAIGSKAAMPVKAPQTSTGSEGVRGWVTAAILLGLLAVPGWLMAPQIYRFATDQGELVIETSDENIKVEVLENGNLFRVLDTTSRDSFDIRSGEYSFNVVGVDSDSEFEITPQSITMKRGGRELVAVKVTLRDKKPQISAGFISGRTKPKTTTNPLRDQASMERLHAIQIKEIKNVCIAYKLQTGSYPKSLADLVRLPAGMTESQWSGPYLRDAVLPKDPWNNAFVYSVDESRDEVSISSKGRPGEKNLNKGNSNDSNALASNGESSIPIYRGRNFEQWFSIAKNDREPQTVSDAIAACGFLADGDQKARFIDLLRSLVRQHGAANCITTFNGGTTNSTNILFTGFAKGICQLEPKEVVEFVQYEAKRGNEQSLGFCSSLSRQADFDGNNTKRLEFFNRLEIDMSVLLHRIRIRHIELDLDTQSFLEAFLNKKMAKRVDLNACKDVIKGLKVDQRPQIYRIFMDIFDEGELDEMVESDFFENSTSGETREQILWMLVDYDGGYFGGLGGGGFGSSQYNASNLHSPTHNRILGNHLIMRAITELVDSSEDQLDFKTLSKIYYDDDGVIQTKNDPNAKVQWKHEDGSFHVTKLASVPKISGRAAIVRNLLTKLCQSVSSDNYSGEDKDKILAFVKKLIYSNESFEELAKADDFKELQIDRDLRSLRDVVKGEKNADEFGRFVTRRSGPGGNGGGFGGGGGGGVF